MITIQNITPDYDENEYGNDYVVCINGRLICELTHDRPDGLAACLRKAADAVDARERIEWVHEPPFDALKKLIKDMPPGIVMVVDDNFWDLVKDDEG